MSKVHILAPEVVSKIAAGEVIERPASVIKELVENALDAGAKQVDIRLEDAGKRLIRIQDNGCGIEREDLEKIFLRHATSKIAKADDLYAVDSFGFRGEALYSVGAVADVMLRSQAEGAREGWELHVRGGEKLDLRPCALTGPGTLIEVRELFFNTPARRKFLKSNTTEIHQILNLFIPYVLLHPSIRFRLTHEDRDIIDAAPAQNPLSRVAGVLNVGEKNLLTAGTPGDRPRPVPSNTQNLQADLILGDINIRRARRDMQFIFVNGRPVQNKSIGFHLNQVYRLIMPEDSYPLFLADIRIPAGDVDVNIHPAKREVKIKDEQKACAILRQLCEETLLKAGQIKQVSGFSGRLRCSPDVMSGSVGVPTAIEDGASEAAFDSAFGTEMGKTSRDYAYPAQAAVFEKQSFFIPQVTRHENLQDKLAGAMHIGILMDKYQLFQAGRSLLIMDQHAAAERVSYERLIRQMNQGEVEVQRLLSPVLVRLSIPETLTWETAQEELARLGLETSLWDKETIAVHSCPVFLKDIEKAVRNILGGEQIAKGGHDALARRACRSSVMAGDILKPQETLHLREELLRCLDPFTCPHGRPTVVEVPEDWLDKQFSRIK